MDRTNQPNVSLPLASSYDKRDTDNTAAALAVGQRKVNSMYEVVNNSQTGSRTLVLAKRPGFTFRGGSLGTANTTQVYLSNVDSGGNVGAFTYLAAACVAQPVGAGITLAAGPSTYRPRFTDRTNLSGVINMVVQLADTLTQKQRMFYATNWGAWTECVAANYTALAHTGKMEFMDGFAFFMTTDNKVWNLDLNSLATLTNTNQFVTKQIEQDVPVGLMRLGNQLLSFGQETMEVFVNGAIPSGSPLVPVKQLSRKVGLVYPALSFVTTHYYATVDKALYFVGRTTAYASTGVYRYDGSSCVKISSPMIDKLLVYDGIDGAVSVNTIAFGGQTAVAFGLTYQSATTARWLMYFPEWNDWFEWNSDIVQPVGIGNGYLIGLGSAAAPSGNKLSFVSTTTITNQDNGVDYQWLHQFRLPSEGNGRKQHKWAGLVGDTARAACDISVAVSDDDYQSFITLGTIDMTQPKKTLYRMGGFYERDIQLTYSGNQPVRLTQFLSRIE